LTFAKPPHDYFLHLCASSATNQTSPEEDQRLAEHLQFCLVCKQACDDFNQIAVQLYGEARAAETVTATFRVADEAPPERLKARELLLSKVRRTIDLPLTEDQPTAIAGKKKMSWVPSLERVPLGVAWRLAAALLLVVGLVLTQSSLSRRHSRDEEATSTRLKREVQELRGELTRLQMIPGKPALEAPPKTRDDGARNLQANNEAIHQTLLNLEAARQREAGENAELQTRIRLLQSSLRSCRP